MELKIYTPSGTLKLTASPNSSSVLSEEVMGEYAVSASFTHTAFAMLDAGDYVILQGVRYKVRSPYRPTQKNMQTYDYQVKLYAPIHDAEDTLMLYQADGDIRTEFSFDGGPREHLQLWVDNMNRVAGADVWSIGTVVTGENKTIDYVNQFCWEAAFGSGGIAAVYATELWTDGYVVNLCKAERGERITLGHGQGLTRLSQEDNGEVRFFTRLFPLGSTRNIDASKYGHARLQLPSGAAYVDKNTELYGIKEAYEESAFAGIYPKYIGTVSSVRTEEKTDEDGRDYTIYYIKDDGMDFNPEDYEIPDLDYMLTFQTGDLAGRGNGQDGSFQTRWHENSREWEIINVYPDSETQIPGGMIVPAVGDTYIPWNFAMPQAYIDAAEEAYAEAVDDFLTSYSFDPKKYAGMTDRNYIENNDTPLMLGQNVRLLSDTYFPDTGYKDTRVVKCVRKLNDLCQATITCTDQIGNGWKTSVENQLNNLQYILAKQAQQAVIDLIKTGEGKTPSDTNVFSALRSLATFLRKDRPDSTNYLLRMLAGLEAGEFIDSLTAGRGAGIMSDGRGQFERLEVRGSMTVLDLIVNYIQGMAADYSFTDTGKIAAVDDLGNDTYRLTMEKRTDFDLTTFQADDVTYSIVNSLPTGGTDFYTSWLRVTAVDAQSNTLTAVLYPGSEVPGGQNYPPVAGYNLTRRGNSILPEDGGMNQRAQSWMLSSREGRIMFLANVYKPMLEDYNYALTVGRIPQMAALDKLPVAAGEVGIVAQTVIAERFYQFDYNGDVVPRVVDRGTWSEAVATGNSPYRNVCHAAVSGSGTAYTLLEQHAVWHLGCRWGCLTDKTAAEPRWNSPHWSLLEGGTDYSVSFHSSGGSQFFAGQVDTVVTATVRCGALDITADLLALPGVLFSWTRDTGNPASDSTWTPVLDGGQPHALRIANADMPLGFGQTIRRVTFTLSVYIPDGTETRPLAQGTVNVK